MKPEPMTGESQRCRDCRWWDDLGDGEGSCGRVDEPDSKMWPRRHDWVGVGTSPDFGCVQWEPTTEALHEQVCWDVLEAMQKKRDAAGTSPMGIRRAVEYLRCRERSGVELVRLAVKPDEFSQCRHDFCPDCNGDALFGGEPPRVGHKALCHLALALEGLGEKVEWRE
jgi:hypothetical protein